jgi:hypothetical protein
MAKTGRPPLGDRAMTSAERQKRYRATRDYKLGITRRKIRKLKCQQHALSRAARLEREVVEASEMARIHHESGYYSTNQFRAKLAEIREVAAKLRQNKRPLGWRLMEVVTLRWQ